MIKLLIKRKGFKAETIRIKNIEDLKEQLFEIVAFQNSNENLVITIYRTLLKLKEFEANNIVESINNLKDEDIPLNDFEEYLFEMLFDILICSEVSKFFEEVDIETIPEWSKKIIKEEKYFKNENSKVVLKKDIEEIILGIIEELIKEEKIIPIKKFNKEDARKMFPEFETPLDYRKERIQQLSYN